MKIGVSFKGMDISARGMTIQRMRSDIISENIANVNTTKGDDDKPYRKKALSVSNVNDDSNGGVELSGGIMKMTNPYHYKGTSITQDGNQSNEGLKTAVVEDANPGELVYMPNHPDANEEGYVQMPNVSIITEMVDMITATRGFEANLTAFNASKQIIKDSLEI